MDQTDGHQRKFEEVAKTIEERIQSEMYKPSQKLPSEYELAAEFGVSRLTVRKAVDTLIQRNILYKLKGKGSYIMSQQKIQSGHEKLQSFTEAGKIHGKVSKTEVLSFKEIPIPEKKIVDALQLPTGIPLWELIRRRLYDGTPMTVEKIYLQKTAVEGYKKEDFGGSLFKLLERKVTIAYSHQEIEATLVTKELEKWLGVPKGSPVFKVDSVTYTKEGNPFFYDTSYYRGDKYTFKNTLIRED